ncbi:hypothetical protein [Variovorax sp. E3]|jgi:hypothetical protein|uniref:hypothetical protein n=1 Tax=Variovorax sp. E3 TaxID=1914993 RepID=UPI0018DE4302|nr:hypothetical protein [Variovorax sp. E3]
MPALANVLNPDLTALWACNTSQEKLEVLLDLASNVDAPPSIDEVCAFVDLLENYWRPSLQEQQALDRVVGSRRSVPGPYDGGFLQGQSALPWRHFSRESIALQLVVRIADYKHIEQKNHPLCGPVTFMHSIARRNIEEYVLYVTGLAENRKGDLGPHTVKVKSNSNLLGMPRSQGENQIREADYIALASLREGRNLFAYRSDLTNRTLEGMSSTAAMKQWMRDAGYRNVEDHAHHEWRLNGLRMKADRTNVGRNVMRPHLQKLQQRLDNGYTVMLVAADSLADMARGKDYSQSALMRVLGGHFMLALSVDVSHDGAKFGLVTWGKEIPANVEIPWSKVASWYRGFVCGQP